jgi:hypothetical protein
LEDAAPPRPRSGLRRRGRRHKAHLTRGCRLRVLRLSPPPVTKAASSPSAHRSTPATSTRRLSPPQLLDLCRVEIHRGAIHFAGKIAARSLLFKIGLSLTPSLSSSALSQCGSKTSHVVHRRCTPRAATVPPAPNAPQTSAGRSRSTQSLPCCLQPVCNLGPSNDYLIATQASAFFLDPHLCARPPKHFGVCYSALIPLTSVHYVQSQTWRLN